MSFKLIKKTNLIIAAFMNQSLDFVSKLITINKLAYICLTFKLKLRNTEQDLTKK